MNYYLTRPGLRNRLLYDVQLGAWSISTSEILANVSLRLLFDDPEVGTVEHSLRVELTMIVHAVRGSDWRIEAMGTREVCSSGPKLRHYFGICKTRHCMKVWY